MFEFFPDPRIKWYASESFGRHGKASGFLGCFGRCFGMLWEVVGRVREALGGMEILGEALG